MDHSSVRGAPEPASRSETWRWSICGLLFLATMLNYMDRQTLAQTISKISQELGLNNEQYGNLELAFGLAFATGCLLFGWLADRLSVRWLYPVVLLGWSSAGFATAYAAEIGRALAGAGLGFQQAPEYLGLLVCRTVLGVFEAGQWPCALITSQRLLTAQNRTAGNSILQSGASLGALLTPLVVGAMMTEQAGTWRGPFQVIGALGVLWVAPWLIMIRARDLARPAAPTIAAPAAVSKADAPAPTGEGARWLFWRRLVVLAVVVVAINACWQFFRAWLPKFLEEFHGYPSSMVQHFTVAYYLATDVGCLAVGFAVKILSGRGWSVQRARMLTFSVCAVLTASCVFAADLPRGPVLLGVLLVIGFGALGLFPTYYSLTQDLSLRHQGKVTGALGCLTWACTGPMQKAVGRRIDETHSYHDAILVMGLLPLVACLALWFFWPKSKE